MAVEGKGDPGRSARVKPSSDPADLVSRNHDEELPIEAEFVDDAVGPVTVNDVIAGARDAIGDVATGARRLVDRGRFRKLRITRKGKPVLPDIPLAAVAAIEAASLYGAGVARVLAANIGAKFLFDVHVVNEADEFLAKGRAALLEGDLEIAQAALERAVRIDDTHAGAFLQLGVLYRLQGDSASAEYVLERAREFDALGESGKRAGEILAAMRQRRG